MRLLFYKEYFEVQLSHALAAGEICTSFTLTPTGKCLKNFQNFKMIFNQSAGMITVSYSGTETSDHSNILVPAPEVPEGTEFLFIVSATDHNILKSTKLPQEPDIHVDDLKKFIPWQFIRPAVFSHTFNNTASSSAHELFSVETEAGVPVYHDTVKRDTEAGGVYACSADLRFADPGIYNCKLGVAAKKFYVDTTSEITGHYGFIRIKKDGTWLKPTSLTSTGAVDYNLFKYTFDKLP